MAESWGGGSTTRCYFSYSYSENATTFYTTITGYLYLPPHLSSNGIYAVNWSGYWGSGGNSVGRTFNMNGYGTSSAIAGGSYSWARNYGSTNTGSFAVSGTTYHGYASHSMSLTANARAYSAPRPPLNQAVVRVNDTQATVSWTANYDSSSGAQPWTTLNIDRWSASSNKWTRVASGLSWSTLSWSDTGIVANDRYRYRVQSVNSGGSSSFAETATFSTTPSAPTGATAQRQGADVVVTWTNTSPAQDGANVYDNDVLVGQVGSGIETYTHAGPDPATTHVYTIRATSTTPSLTSAASAPSNSVTLESKPNPPQNVAFEDTTVGFAGTGDTPAPVLTWQHNPTDSSQQRIRQIRFRKVGDTAWTVSTAVTTSSEKTSSGTGSGSIRAMLGAAWAVGQFEFQVLTYGSHASPSEYSASAFLTIENEPTVTITSPVSGSTIGLSRITAGWTYAQAQSRAQAQFTLELLSGTQVVWSTTQSSAVSTFAIPSPLLDDTSYTLRLSVRSSTGLISDVAVSSFSVNYLEPSTPTVNAIFNPDTGAHQIEISNDDVPTATALNRVYRNINQDSPWMNANLDIPLPPPETNLFTNPRLVGDGTWAGVRRNRVLNPTAATGTGEVGAYGSNLSVRRVTFGGVPAFEVEVTGNVFYIGLWVNIGTLFTAGERAAYSFEVRSETGKQLTGSVIGYIGGLGGNDANRDTAPSMTVDNAFRTVSLVNPSVTEITSGIPYPQRVYFALTGQSFPVGTKLYFRRVFVGDAGPYFDGSTTSETAVGVTQPEDFRWRWLGTPNESESLMTIERVRGVATNAAIAGVSTWEGKPAARIVPVSSGSNQSVARITIPAVAQTLGTAIGTLHMIQPLTGTLWDRRGTLYASNPLTITTPAAPNVAGTTDIRLQFADQASNAVVDFVNGASQNNGDVWWTDIGLFAGNYTGGAFSGDDLAHYDENGFWVTYSWAGEQNNSPSVKTYSYPPIVEGEWELVDEIPANTTTTDFMGVTYGRTVYRVEAVSSIPSSSFGYAGADASSTLVWLGAGPGYRNTCGIPYDILIDEEDDLAFSEEHYFEGRDTAVLVTGTAASRRLAVSGTLDPLRLRGATWEELRRIARTPGTKCYRDHDGRRIIANLPGGITTVRARRDLRHVSFSVSEVENE